LARLFLKAAKMQKIKNNLNSERLFLNPFLARLFLKAATYAEFIKLVPKFFCIVVILKPYVIQLFDVSFIFSVPKL
jgi:hypothetical protein